MSLNTQNTQTQDDIESTSGYEWLQRIFRVHDYRGVLCQIPREHCMSTSLDLHSVTQASNGNTSSSGDH